MKSWAAIALALTVGVPGTVAIAPAPSVAQERLGRTLSPDEVRELRRRLSAALSRLDHAIDQRNTAHRQISAERRRVAAAEADLQDIARIFGLPADTPKADVAEYLEQWAEQDAQNREKLVELTAIVSRIENGDVRQIASNHLKAAQEAFDDGRLDDAADALARLESVRGASFAELGDLWIEAVLARVGLAQQNRDYDQADALLTSADQFQERQSRIQLFKIRKATAYNSRLRAYHSNNREDYLRSVTLFRSSIQLIEASDSPSEWSDAQHQLSEVLSGFAARTQNLELYREALGASQQALGARARDRFPIEWAESQNQIGILLLSIGLRSNDRQLIADGLAAYNRALEVRTREADPVAWGITTSNIAMTHHQLGQADSGASGLSELGTAIAIYRSALEEMTETRAPFNHAVTRHALGYALRTLAARERSSARFREAITEFQGALNGFAGSGYPLNWASGQFDLHTTMKHAVIWGTHIDRSEYLRADLQRAAVVFEQNNQGERAVATHTLIRDLDALLG